MLSETPNGRRILTDAICQIRVCVLQVRLLLYNRHFDMGFARDLIASLKEFKGIKTRWVYRGHRIGRMVPTSDNRSRKVYSEYRLINHGELLRLDLCIANTEGCKPIVFVPRAQGH